MTSRNLQGTPVSQTQSYNSPFTRPRRIASIIADSSAQISMAVSKQVSGSIEEVSSENSQETNRKTNRNNLKLTNQSMQQMPFGGPRKSVPFKKVDLQLKQQLLQQSSEKHFLDRRRSIPVATKHRAQGVMA